MRAFKIDKRNSEYDISRAVIADLRLTHMVR